MLMLLCVLIAIVIAIFYMRERYSKFSRHKINHLPVLPIFGNALRTVVRPEHIYKIFDDLYKAFPEDRLLGFYEFFEPVHVVCDAELLKKIAVKDYEHFINRREVLHGVEDPFFTRSLLMMKDEEWKDMRSSLSPAFTSSKIRLMVPMMVEVSENMSQLLKKRILESEDGYIDLEFRDLTSRYANDVIATCAFGLKTDSQSGDQFYNMSTDFISLKPIKFVKFLTLRNIPFLNTKMDLSVVSRNAYNFFRNVLLSTMKHREQKNIVRNDMIHLLMEAKKGRLRHDSKDKKDADAGFATVEESEVGKKIHNREWSDTDLVSQALLFLFAGYETVSTTMSFLAHELALNPDVQDKLAKEIREHAVKNGGNFDYNSVQNTTYMDMVVSEVLRLYPPAPDVDRGCRKDYNVGRPNKNSTKDYIIRKGEGVFIPIWSFHHDPKHFPEPYKFDPERFSEENKHRIKTCTYMPFGLGPRNCIGSRFALCEVKVMAYHLLQTFELSPCEKTCIPTVLKDDRLNLRIKGGFWVRLKIRE